jgi:DNA-binding CsgD family transcriptional regulator
MRAPYRSLGQNGASTRAIGQELGIAPSTVREYLARVARQGSVGIWARM